MAQAKDQGDYVVVTDTCRALKSKTGTFSLLQRCICLVIQLEIQHAVRIPEEEAGQNQVLRRYLR
jgi:hypothetical protein